MTGTMAKGGTTAFFVDCSRAIYSQILSASKPNPPFFFIRRGDKLVQCFDDAANGLVVFADGGFQFGQLGGEFLVRRDGLPEPDEGVDDQDADLFGAG